MKTKQVLNVLVTAALGLGLNASVFAAASALQVGSATAALAAALAGGPNAVALESFRADVSAGKVNFATAVDAVNYAKQHGYTVELKDVESRMASISAMVDTAKANAVQTYQVEDTSSVFTLTGSISKTAEQCSLAKAAPVSNRETLKAGNAAQPAVQNLVYTMLVFGAGSADQAASNMAGLIYSEEVGVAQGVQALAPKLAQEIALSGEATSCELNAAARKAALEAGQTPEQSSKLASDLTEHCGTAFGVKTVNLGGC